jgi:hypothetical protein
MRISYFAVILVALLILPALFFAIAWAIRSFSGVRLGHAMLTCPNCGEETPANLDACQKCGRSLR